MHTKEVYSLGKHSEGFSSLKTVNAISDPLNKCPPKVTSEFRIHKVLREMMLTVLLQSLNRQKLGERNRTKNPNKPPTHKTQKQ